MKISELKKEAIAKLSGKWGKAAGIYIVVTLLSFGLTLVPSLIPQQSVAFLINLLISIISFSFSYGLLASMIKLSRTEKVDLMDFVPLGLKNLFKIIKLYLLMILKLWLPILLYVGSAIAIGFSAYVMATGSVTTGLAYFIASCAILVVACILFIVKSLLYSLAFYLLYDNPNAKTKELLNKSAELMKGKRVKFVLTEFSFLGWLLLIVLASALSVAVLPVLTPILLLVGTTILSPYMTFTLINFYEHVAGINDVKAEAVSE